MHRVGASPRSSLAAHAPCVLTPGNPTPHSTTAHAKTSPPTGAPPFSSTASQVTCENAAMRCPGDAMPRQPRDKIEPDTDRCPSGFQFQFDVPVVVTAPLQVPVPLPLPLQSHQAQADSHSAKWEILGNRSITSQNAARRRSCCWGLPCCRHCWERIFTPSVLDDE
jgi:hypothetical protein